MRKIGKCCGIVSIALIVVSFANVNLYHVIDEGELYQPEAEGDVSIVRQSDAGISRMRGESYLSVVHAQGFSHAQTHLWQLERTRRVIRGETSELFGKDTLMLDKFMRGLDLRRLA